MMTHEQSFIRDICEHPDDDAPRLIFADWLEEGMDVPHHRRERAELIRLQCRLAEMDEDGEGAWAEEGHTCVEEHCPHCEAFGRHAVMTARCLRILQCWDSFWTKDVPLLLHACIPHEPGNVWRRGFIEEACTSWEAWQVGHEKALMAHSIKVVRLTTPPHVGTSLKHLKQWPDITFVPPHEHEPDLERDAQGTMTWQRSHPSRS